MLMAYPCDLTGGMRLVDTSGAGLHGTLIGTEYAMDDERGRVLQFEGQRSHVAVSDVKLGAFTFSAWIKPLSRDIDKRVLMQFSQDVPLLSIQGNALGSMGLVAACGTEINDVNWPLARGQWSHVCVTYDGDRVVFYRNGRLVLAEKMSLPLPAEGQLTLGGVRGKLRQSWPGRMDDIMIVDRSLDSGDVKELYRLGSGLPVQPSRVPSDEIIIEAFIDDASELHILPDLIYWENTSKRAKPGRHSNRNEPTWINGRPWYPHWFRHEEIGGLDMSSQYGLSIKPPRYAAELVAVGSSRRADRIERGSIEACRDGQSLIIRFKDLEYGPRWYRVRLYPWRYVDPVEACRAASPNPCGKMIPVAAVVPCPPKADPPPCEKPVPKPEPQFVVQATEMPPVPRPVLPLDSMVVDAYVDEVSDLWIKGDGLIWKNVTAAAKPGRGDGRNEPTYINGQPWYPAWIEQERDQGIDLSELHAHPLKPGFYHAKLLAVGEDRENWSKEQAEKGDFVETIELPESLVVRFTDPGRHPQWYRILVTRRSD
jgi:hypothetical protein